MCRQSLKSTICTVLQNRKRYIAKDGKPLFRGTFNESSQKMLYRLDFENGTRNHWKTLDLSTIFKDIRVDVSDVPPNPRNPTHARMRTRTHMSSQIKAVHRVHWHFGGT